jgi:gliding motility-associated-like protein
MSKILNKGSLILSILLLFQSGNLLAQCVNAGSDMTICQGGTTPPLAGSFGGDAAGPVWSDVVGGTFSNVNILNPTWTPPASFTGFATLTLKATSGTCSPLTASIQVTVDAPLPVSVTIAANANPVCAGTLVTFTATPVNGGLSPSYQWRVNSSNAGTNSPTFSYTPVNGDQVDCILTSSATCATGSPATSGGVTMTVNPTPATPVVTVVDNCNSTSTLSTTATGSLLWSTGETTSTIVVTVAKAYTVTTTVNGCISLPGSGTAAPNTTPPPPSVGTITAPTCALATGSVILSGLPATGTWTLTGYPGTITSTGTGTSSTVSGLSSGTYNFTVSSQAGCTSGLSANVVIPSQPVTPSPPSVGTITQPTCSVATGSVILNGLPAGNWTINPGNHVGNTASTTISGLAAGSYTFTVTNSVGCTSGASADVVINTQPATPAPPVVGAITQPTCSQATGSVVLSGLPPTGLWTLTGMPGNIINMGTGTSTTVSGLVANTYAFTVTSSDGCTSSSSGNVVIDAQPPSPSIPTQTVDCSLGFDHAVVTVTSPLGTGLMYNIDGGAYTSATSFTNILNGSHTITVMNTAGCTTTGTAFSVSCGCVNGPSVKLSSISGSTCVTTPVTVSGNTFGGSATNVAITENGDGTVSPSSSNTSPFSFTYTPGATDAGNMVIITVTTNNPLGAPCTSAVATYSLTVNAIPTPPSTGTITQPTCAVATGSVILNGLPSSGLWTITRTPGDVTTTGNGVSTVISGLDPGTYSFTVTSGAGCTSASSGNVIILSQPGTLSAPVVGAIIQPTCLVSTGSVTLSGLPATDTWTLTRSPGAIVTTGTGVTETITSLAPGVYTYTVSNLTGCISAPSSNVVINSQPFTPTPPTVGDITQPTCTLSSGAVALGGLPATGTWTLTRYPGTVNTAGAGLTTTISGLLPGVYNFTVANDLGCTSLASGNVLITTQPVTPSAPVIGTITQPTCNIPTGSVILSGLPSSDWVLTSSPGGTTLTGTSISSTFSGLTSGTHTFTVTNSAGCVSLPSGPVIIVANASAPTLLITNPSPVCIPGTADLTSAFITSGSTPGLTFTYWKNANATNVFTTPAAAPEGVYYIKATDPSTGCSDIKSVTVTVRHQPAANAGPDQVLEYLFSTKLDALEPGVNETGTWSVLKGTGVFVNAGDAGTTVSNLSVGNNILLWTLTNGACPSSEDSVTITVHDLIIPTLITPNHDGKNDYFVIKAREALGRIELTVFDRNGARVFRNDDYNNDWDGVDDRGNPLPDDTYFFIIRTQTGKTISKYIVIRR